MAKIELIENSDSDSADVEEPVEDVEGDQDPNPESSPGQARKQNPNRSHQKAVLRERKARRLHSNVVTAARVAWGAESIKTAPVEQRIRRVEAVLCEIRDLITQICLKHDVSRLVQACIKYGNDTQRALIGTNLKGHVIELCTHQYGHHVILKMLRYGSRPILASILNELRGNIARLSQHRLAFKIVDLTWRSSCNTQQKNEWLFEFYGKEQSLFRDTTQPAPSMPQLLQSLDEKKRDAVLSHVRNFIDRCTGKGTVQLSVFHTLLRHYLENVTDRDSVIESLKDQTIQICGTLDGVIATCIMLDYASSKIRKAIVKSWKGQIATMAKDSDGYLAVAKALTIIDDSVLVQKCIINEMLEDMSNLMQSAAGSRVLLQVLVPGQARYFTVAERNILQTVTSMSKKSDEARRNDNLRYIVPAIINVLHSDISIADIMLRDRPLSGLFESCLKCAMEMSVDVQTAAKDYMKDFVSSLSDGDLTDLDQDHIVAHPVAHRVFKSLCVSSQSLMHPVFTDFCLSHLQAILKSRAVWVLVPLVESLPQVRASVKKALKKIDRSAVPGLKKLKELCQK